MKIWYVAGLAMGMSLVTVSCSDTPAPAVDTRVADEKAIRDGENAWNLDFKARDVDKLVNHYAENAVLMSPNEHLVKGRSAIRTEITEMLRDKNFASTCTTSTVEVAKSGDIAYSQGSCVYTMSNPKTGKPANQTGNYVTVYKKQSGNLWKAVEDILTPAVSPAPPASPAKKTKTKAARRRK